MNTAVILCARKERDSKIPYPLIPFSEGVTLLGRSIDILQEIGINKIYVVIGYQADMFKPYEGADVQLIIKAYGFLNEHPGSQILFLDYHILCLYYKKQCHIIQVIIK